MQYNSGFAMLAEESKTRVREITAAELKEKMKENAPFYLVDVREASEWDKGYLPGAVHLSKGIIERDIEQVIPDKQACIVLYCGGGQRSALAGDNIQKMGYQNVYSLRGGYRGF